jgi:glycosyltransferase involved in cell wall biosynthesis
MERVARLVDDLATTWPDLEVHVIGAGPDEVLVRSAVADLDRSGQVTVHGYVEAEQKDRLLRSAWLHVSASHGEGWGLSVIEAAACGVPTVAYDVDGLRDAVRDGETGWLVASGEDLADTVSRALKEIGGDPRRAAEIRDACLARAAEFDWERSGGQMARLMRAEMGRASGDPAP